MPSILDTDTIFADKYNVFGGEAAFTWGPFSTQAEYAASQVTNALIPDTSGTELLPNGQMGTAIGDPILQAFYIQASFFLTGRTAATSTASTAASR